MHPMYKKVVRLDPPQYVFGIDRVAHMGRDMLVLYQASVLRGHMSR